MKKRKDEHLAERSARKARKIAEKRCTEVPRNRAHAARPNHPRTGTLGRGAKWHDRAMWHGWAVQCGTPVSCGRFGLSSGSILARSPHASGHDRAAPVSASRLKFLPRLFPVLFSFSFHSVFPFTNALRRFLGFIFGL